MFRDPVFSVFLGFLLAEPHIQVSLAVLVALQATLVALASTEHTAFRPLLVASATLQLCAAVSLGLLSHWEHRNTVRPSILISTYLILTSVLDAARVRTQALIPGQTNITGILIATVAVKLVALMIESRGKTSLLVPEYAGPSAELHSNIFSRAFFLWLNPLLSMGFRNVLSIQDLPGIHEKLASKALASRVQTNWESSEFISDRYYCDHLCLYCGQVTREDGVL